MIGNPIADKGHGEKDCERVFDLLSEAGDRHGFTVIDLTGGSYDDSLRNAHAHADLYDALVVVGGDGMIALGANAVGGTGTPLGIVAVGSGNDFARGLGLPVNRLRTAVNGIAGAIVRGSAIDVDLGRVDPSRASAADAVAAAGAGAAGDGVVGAADAAGAAGVADADAEAARGGERAHGGVMAGGRYFAGMLSCGIDAKINDRANHSRLPNGSLRYLAAVLVELTRLRPFGYHIRATRADGSVDERDIVSPLLTVANSRHIGGGIEVSPYSRFDDGLLDLVWIDHMPTLGELARVVPNIYNGRLLSSRLFGWERVRDVEISRIDEGAEPPVLMADGEYIGDLPVRVAAMDRQLRVLVPPAVAERGSAMTRDGVSEAIARDGRDPLTGMFL